MLPTSHPYARIRRALVVLMAASLLGGAVPARAELLASAPVWAVGLTLDDDARGIDREIATAAVGWRFRFGPGATLARAAERVGTELSFVIEPLFGVLLGDAETVEAAVVPMFHLEPRRDWRVRPYFEAGVGLIYNDLRGFDLGSRILFSDQGGAGLVWQRPGGGRFGLGYRFRHISHAGLWADANDGLNTHFLVLTLD